MSTPTSSTPTTAAPTPAAPKPTSPAAAVAPAAGSPLESAQGKTVISDGVVAKIAGLAAREVHGVHGFGGSAARAFGALTERIPGARSSSTQGVSVEVGERQAAVDVTVVVEYGVAITELARAIRRNVIGAVEQMTGLQVVEVNVDVVDLHLPDDDTADAPAAAPARVR
ncbi:Asp23/Gls24 family envelope stress response protein [Actinomycetospora sp. TBRC 11914]|uniref:Asp23/Gls24 family envelope stress response protein n=1 Tax=Actinomycetospora sp. TBRC 11914 TaxID=2729387 RepID=UPI00145EB25F|nr:Asp23/Gls24 family envelope stress response protein [Actinomycetospora sp. TBRC 11914]NMO91354.1 Asp23/Gls24 family envelope stress response protein [Actinomycetospora sp. TBRC 11914]